jgi:hypothetical protein
VADYKSEQVSQTQAYRAVRSVRQFLKAIQSRGGETR